MAATPKTKILQNDENTHKGGLGHVIIMTLQGLFATTPALLLALVN
jgi:hypothetical protein